MPRTALHAAVPNPAADTAEAEISLKNRYRTLLAVVGAALLAALIVVPSFGAFRQVKKVSQDRERIHQVILGGDDFLSALKDAETSQRGYVLTGDPAFLEPYRAVQASLPGQLVALRQRTLNDAARGHLEALRGQC